MSYLERLTSAGRYVLALAFVAFGMQDLVCLKPTLGLEPLPGWLPAPWLWAVLSGAVLIGCGLSILINRRAGLAATVAGGLLTFWILALHLPRLVAAPTNGSAWTVGFETLAIVGAAWTLAGGAARRAGRLAYGFSLPVFGVLHIIYWQYIVSVLPAWLPWPLFWTYGTAAAFLAAGAAIVSGVHARLAAIWTGIMFLSWVLMLHAPRVALNSSSRAEWTSLLVALAMGGGAWIIGNFLPSNSAPAPEV